MNIASIVVAAILCVFANSSANAASSKPTPHRDPSGAIVGQRTVTPAQPQQSQQLANDQTLILISQQTDLVRYLPSDLVWVNREQSRDQGCTPEGNVFHQTTPEFVCHVYKSPSTNTAWVVRFRMAGNQYDRIWKVEANQGRLTLVPWKGPGSFVSSGATQFAAAHSSPNNPQIAENTPPSGQPEDCQKYAYQDAGKFFECAKRNLSLPMGTVVKPRP